MVIAHLGYHQWTDKQVHRVLWPLSYFSSASLDVFFRVWADVRPTAASRWCRMHCLWERAFHHIRALCSIEQSQLKKFKRNFSPFNPIQTGNLSTHHSWSFTVNKAKIALCLQRGSIQSIIIPRKVHNLMILLGFLKIVSQKTSVYPLFNYLPVIYV